VELRQAVATPGGAPGEEDAKFSLRFISVGCNRLVNAAALFTVKLAPSAEDTCVH
jgi:hypothetical protein